MAQALLVRAQSIGHRARHADPHAARLRVEHSVVRSRRAQRLTHHARQFENAASWCVRRLPRGVTRRQRRPTTNQSALTAKVVLQVSVERAGEIRRPERPEVLHVLRDFFDADLDLLRARRINEEPKGAGHQNTVSRSMIDAIAPGSLTVLLPTTDDA